MFGRVCAVISALCFVVPAWAQQPPKTDPDWKALLVSVRNQRDKETQLRQDAQAELEAASKKAAELDAYLKACGDKPGCTVPAQP